MGEHSVHMYLQYTSVLHAVGDVVDWKEGLGSRCDADLVVQPLCDLGTGDSHPGLLSSSGFAGR